MEEDTGKSLHVGGATGRIHGADHSLVDYNRAGIPLIEIVTKPISGHPGEGADRRAGLRRPAARPAARRSASPTPAWSRARCAATSTSRCAPAGSGALGTRTETKNVNSLRSVERAVRYEISRQAAVLDAGRPDRTGDAALARGHRRHHARPGEVRRRGLPLLPRAGPGAGGAVAASGSRSCAARCPSPPRDSGPGCRPTGASATSRCATPSVPARSSWSRRPSPPVRRRRRPASGGSSELARRANEQGVEITALGVTPGRRGRACRRWSTRARSTTSWPGRCSTACSPARARPTRSSRPAASPWSPTRARSRRAVDRAIEANPDVADKIRDGKVAAAGALIGAVMKEMRGQADAGRVRELKYDPTEPSEEASTTFASARARGRHPPGPSSPS